MASPSEVIRPEDLKTCLALDEGVTYAQKTCSVQAPVWKEVAPDRFALCPFARQGDLEGAERPDPSSA